MTDPRVGMKLIEHVAMRVGGVEALSRKLGMPQREIIAYLSGDEIMPDGVFLKLADLVADQWPPAPKESPSSPP
jgi:hypothetical protein